MAWLDYVGYAFLLGIMAIIAATVIMVGVASQKKDAQEELSMHIRNLAVANFFLILIFAYFVNYFLKSKPEFTNDYMFFMVHVAVYLSLLAVSIGSLQKTA
jgi:hypothetical protein